MANPHPPLRLFSLSLLTFFPLVENPRPSTISHTLSLLVFSEFFFCSGRLPGDGQGESPIWPGSLDVPVYRPNFSQSDFCTPCFWPSPPLRFPALLLIPSPTRSLTTGGRFFKPSHRPFFRLSILFAMKKPSKGPRPPLASSYGDFRPPLPPL